MCRCRKRCWKHHRQYLHKRAESKPLQNSGINSDGIAIFEFNLCFTSQPPVPLHCWRRSSSIAFVFILKDYYCTLGSFHACCWLLMSPADVTQPFVASSHWWCIHSKCKLCCGCEGESPAARSLSSSPAPFPVLLCWAGGCASLRQTCIYQSRTQVFNCCVHGT